MQVTVGELLDNSGSMRHLRKLQSDITVIARIRIEPGAFGDVVVTADYVDAALSSSSEIGTVIGIEGAGVCGNGICETREACSSTDSLECCLTDCPVVMVPCPTPQGSDQQCGGHGICLSGYGACDCFTEQVLPFKACVFYLFQEDERPRHVWCGI